MCCAHAVWCQGKGDGNMVASVTAVLVLTWITMPNSYTEWLLDIRAGSQPSRTEVWITRTASNRELGPRQGWHGQTVPTPAREKQLWAGTIPSVVHLSRCSILFCAGVLGAVGSSTTPGATFSLPAHVMRGPHFFTVSSADLTRGLYMLVSRQVGLAIGPTLLYQWSTRTAFLSVYSKNLTAI